MENNKKITIVIIITLLLFVIGGTYAFFELEVYGNTSQNATVTSNTTDLLTFNINQDISFTVTQNDFQENGENQSGEATATATLTPNNKTGSATMNYYLFLNIENNPIVYSSANTNHDPELLLQVFDNNNNLVTLNRLGARKTINGLVGYDITGVNGVKTLLDNHEIIATNNTQTIENWHVVITLINLDVNQNDNTGKTFSASIVIQQDELMSCDVNPDNCITLASVNKSNFNSKQLDVDCNEINAVWNNKYQQLEVSSMGSDNTCNMEYDNVTGTIPLNTYIISLENTTQGEGKLIHETVQVPTSNATWTKVLMDYESSSTDQLSVVDNEYIGTHSTSNSSSLYRFYPLSDGYYRVCFSIPTSTYSSYSYDSNLNYITLYDINVDFLNDYYIREHISSNITNYMYEHSGETKEKCVEYGYLHTTDVIQISDHYYNDNVTLYFEKTSNLTTLDTGYRYEGKNPDNYVWFNNELWRIIGVFGEDSHGQSNKQLVKIIRDEQIGYLDRENQVTWEDSPVRTLLNSSYYNHSIDTENCFAWQYANISPVCDYRIKGIQDNFHNMIEDVTWYLGTIKKAYSYSEDYYYYPSYITYQMERDVSTVPEGKSASVTNKIGLLYYSDYLFAPLASGCMRNNSRYSDPECSGNNWLSTGDNITHNFTTNNIKPVLYLSSDVYKVSGAGTLLDPYMIGL